MKQLLYISSLIILFLSACSKDEITQIEQEPVDQHSNSPKLIFKIHFDSTLTRLDNFGNPATIPTGNAAQSPNFKKISAHYIELAPDSFTQIGNGFIAYKGAETTAGGSNAVDFDQAVVISDNEIIYQMPLTQATPGIYKWIRVSLTYQNYDIKFLSNGIDYIGTLASFVGFNTYVTNYTINTQTIPVHANKVQGYWGFETFGLTFEGQAPGTTVPNPIASSSPVPAGSCVVTGDFPSDLLIVGNENEDIIVNINLSTNNSFEWKDLNGDGQYEPSDGTNPGDTVVDMGLRGLFPTWQ
jgi:hypothetical protein